MKTSGEFREILKVKVDPEADPTIVIKTERGDLAEYPAEAGIFHPEGAMAIEDFLAGQTIRWAFYHSEFQYILKGKAEMSYTLAPWHDETKTVIVEAGDAMMIPTGADITWKIFPGEPFRKLCVTMPAEPQYQVKAPLRVEPYQK